MRFLVQLCKELGLPFEEYASQLRQLERQMEALEARYPFQQGGGVYFYIYRGSVNFPKIVWIWR